MIAISLIVLLVLVFVIIPFFPHRKEEMGILIGNVEDAGEREQ